MLYHHFFIHFSKNFIQIRVVVEPIPTYLVTLGVRQNCILDGTPVHYQFTYKYGFLKREETQAKHWIDSISRSGLNWGHLSYGHSIRFTKNVHGLNRKTCQTQSNEFKPVLD